MTTPLQRTLYGVLPDELERWLRNQLFLEPGSVKDAILARELDRRIRANPDGSVGLAGPVPTTTGVVAWGVGTMTINYFSLAVSYVI